MIEQLMPPCDASQTWSAPAAGELPARLAEAGRTARRLRARLARVLADGGRDAARLEQLHQDLLQGLAAARLLVELAPADPSAASVRCRAALDRFERLAPLWLHLADDGAPPAPSASVRDLCDLLSTEAAVRGVALRVREAPGPAPRCAVDLRAAARRAAAELHLAGRGGTLEISVTSLGTITWDARRAGGDPACPSRPSLAA